MKELIDQLAERAWAVAPSFLRKDELSALHSAFQLRLQAGSFRPAGVGKGVPVLAPEIRRDEISWFDTRALNEAESSWWERLESFKNELNEGLFLGLWETEGHFAAYPPGGFYQKHLDRFKEDDKRVVSVVLYLNDDWSPAHGGELAIYSGGQTHLIEPRAGTFVCFLSDRIEHEVRESFAPRHSFAGWMKRR